jgi:aminopeptidase S
MAGAHLDSVTAGPGINDDGSGIAALLAIAARQKETGHLRFGFWTAEELGLFGSRHYAGALTPRQRKDISGYLNLDMLGSPNPKVVVYGDGKEMKRAVEDAFGREVPEIDIGAASDHWPFEQAGIPTAGIYSGGDEPGPGGKDRDECYHRACDTVRHADAKVAARLTRVADEALVSLAGSG